MSAWRVAAGALAILILAVTAEAGDLAALRRAVERDDRPAVERWLAAETTAADTDPLAPLASRAVPRALRDRAAQLDEGELATTWLAVAWLTSSDPAVKTELLRRIDTASTLRLDLDREMQRAARAPRPLAFTKLYTTGAVPSGPPASVFTPDERTIRVRLAYEQAVPGETLNARWLVRAPEGAREVGRSSATLARAADVAELSLTPAAGARWLEGAYRVEISGRGAVLREMDFVVEAPRAGARPRPDVAARSTSAAAPPPASAPRPPAGPPPAVVAPPSPAPPPAVVAPPAPPPAVAARPPDRPEAAGPAGPVTVLSAVLARDIAGSEPRDLVVEFTTARRRLLLWTRVQSDRGGTLTARWYTRDGGDRLLGEHALAVPAGESRIAYWLEPTEGGTSFRRGPMRVDLVAEGRVVRSLDFRIREAGFLEGMNETLGQFGRELEKLIKGEAR